MLDDAFARGRPSSRLVYLDLLFGQRSSATRVVRTTLGVDRVALFLKRNMRHE